jgi:hypothetical protein
LAKSVEEIISFAMELSDDARLQIAHRLASSVEDAPINPDALQDARRRSQELQSGEHVAMDFDDAMRKARDLLRQCK